MKIEGAKDIYGYDGMYKVTESGCCNGKIKRHMKCSWQFQEIAL